MDAKQIERLDRANALEMRRVAKGLTNAQAYAFLESCPTFMLVNELYQRIGEYVDFKVEFDELIKKSKLLRG